MRLSLGQELRQEQRQVLAQRMIQSMEILQLTLLQLEQRIDQELEQNPVLELVADSGSESDPFPEFDHAGNEDAGTESGILRKQEIEPEIKFAKSEMDGISTEEFSVADDFANNYSDTIDEAPVRSQNWLEAQEDRRNDIFSNIPAPGETLQSHLEEQLGWFDISGNLREMTLRIINNLDQCGYFPYELSDFLGEDASEEDLKLAEEALSLVRRLEPAGVGGRNLQDCLLLQIDPQSPHARILRLLIQSHLGNISLNRVPIIARETGVHVEHIQEAVAELRHFNPRPGAGFGTTASAAVIPDVVVEKIDTGKYSVHLENGRSTQLRISQYYQDMLKKKQETSKETRNYIRQNIGSAKWLLDAIEQRRMTLLKVAQAIVDHQTDFFDKGLHALKPLKMQQIADTVGIHITTVSRACEEKWMTSPQGIFPLRRFFIGGLETSDSSEEDVAYDVVRLKLQEIIDGEDKENPLSDDAIVDILNQQEGIQIARRTIAKYRRLMNIPSSRGRKQW
ncbi:MAG: RNA polymerase factor sigma-54 [Planctomycetaceae bacterium]|nr:RNA polymerase factor sigma-54 [Planctomycetaceae bacterium]